MITIKDFGVVTNLSPMSLLFSVRVSYAYVTADKWLVLVRIFESFRLETVEFSESDWCWARVVSLSA